MNCRYDDNKTECDGTHHHFCEECKRDMDRPLMVININKLKEK